MKTIAHSEITPYIQENSRILEIGCANGDLLAHIQTHYNADCRGVELSMEGVRTCMKRGLSVIQGNADTDLSDYPDDCFDTTILINTLQATLFPKDVLANIARISDTIIITIPNFAHWKNIYALTMQGRMPVTPAIPLEWYDTPNLHFCTIKDFIHLCDQLELKIQHSAVYNENMQKFPFSATNIFANKLGASALFVVRKK